MVIVHDLMTNVQRDTNHPCIYPNLLLSPFRMPALANPFAVVLSGSLYILKKNIIKKKEHSRGEKSEPVARPPTM